MAFLDLTEFSQLDLRNTNGTIRGGHQTAVPLTQFDSEA